MPCHLHLLSFLDNLKLICAGLKNKEVPIAPGIRSNLEDADELWCDVGIKTDDSENGNQTSWKPPSNWINSCFSAISLFSDVLVLSSPQRTFFLTSKFAKTEENEESQKFVVAADKYLALQNGEVTCVFVLPIFYQRKSQHSSPDWTCAMVGFSSGSVGMYTESGGLLFSQQVMDSPVRNIHYEIYSLMEYEGDLIIEGDAKVVAIEGFVLLQTLKACRNQFVRSKAGKSDVAQPPPLLCKRWSFPDAKKFQSSAIVGPKQISMFDYLLSESLHSGPGAYPQAAAPVINSALTTGGDLFLGFHHISETAGPQALSDVAVAFASKIKTMLTPSIGSKLVTGLWNNQEEKTEVQNVAADSYINIPLKFGFFDKTKQGNKIYLSPDRTLAAVTDNHNRILIMDVNRGLCVRIFKGYRDAQCGWMRSDELDECNSPSLDQNSSYSRRAHYLIIYLPKRGILEIWLAPKGHKVEAFNVNRMGKLFYPGICVLGLNALHQQQMRKISSKIGSLVPCCLLEPNGNITAIITSFKDSLQKPLDGHSYDLSLFDDLQKSIDSYLSTMEGKHLEEIKELLSKIESFEFLKKVIHLLIISFASKTHCKEFFLSCIDCLVERFTQLDEINIDQQRIVHTCHKLLQLADIHKAIQKMNHEASREIPDKDLKVPPDLQTLSSAFSIGERETADIISALSLHSEVTMCRPCKRKRVSFVEEFDTDSLGFFIDQFNIFDRDAEIDMPHLLPVNLDEHKLDSISLGQLFYDLPLKHNSTVEVATKTLESSGISGLELMKLLLTHWLNGNEQTQYWKHWINLHSLLKFCFQKISTDNSNSKNKNINTWKEEVLMMLSETSNLEAAYIACFLLRAIVCNDQLVKDMSVAKQLNSADESENSEESKTDIKEWETLTEESVAWKILGNRLEDLLVLDSLLKAKNTSENTETNIHAVKQGKPTYGSSHPISVCEILQRGQGAVSEVVAEWAVFNDLLPDFFKFEPSSRSTDEDDDTDSSEPHYVADGKRLAPIKSLLREVSKRFPRCCDPEAILANTSWENIVSWNKKPDKIDKLQASQKHLNAIKSSHLKNGVACMMWKSFILPRFEALALLMEKVGKAPKDRLCKQDLLMNSNHLEMFLEVCCNLLEYFLEDKKGHCEEEESITPLPPDDLWRQSLKEKPKITRSRTYSGGNKPGLVVLASDTGPPHFSTVHSHYTLAKAMLFIVSFELKNTRPLTHFFDKQARVNFFGELHKEIPMEYNNPPTSIQNSRLEFLKKVATQIVERIPDTPPPNSKASTVGTTTPKGSNFDQNPQLQASKWVNQVLLQAKSWDVESDKIICHYVCELYSSGHDRLAEEAMNSVVNKATLASELLIIGGQRVANIVLSSSNTNVKLADIPPKLSTWIRSLNPGSLRNCNINLKSTRTLIGLVMSFMDDEKSPEYKMSLDLFEAINNLM